MGMPGPWQLVEQFRSRPEAMRQRGTAVSVPASLESVPIPGVRVRNSLQKGPHLTNRPSEPGLTDSRTKHVDGVRNASVFPLQTFGTAATGAAPADRVCLPARATRRTPACPTDMGFTAVGQLTPGSDAPSSASLSLGSVLHHQTSTGRPLADSAVVRTPLSR